MKIAYYIWTLIEQSPINYVNTGFCDSVFSASRALHFRCLTSTVGSRGWSLKIAEEGIKI